MSKTKPARKVVRVRQTVHWLQFQDPECFKPKPGGDEFQFDSNSFIFFNDFGDFREMFGSVFKIVDFGITLA
jgi:hypothetical protein